MKYSKQLEDERWQVKRRKILQRDDFKCTECNNEDSLNVHHLYYAHFKMAWQYPNDALITLCNKCHKKWHLEHVVEIREDIYSSNKKEYAPIKKRVYKKTKLSRSAKNKIKLEKQKNKLFNIANYEGLDLNNEKVLNIINNNQYSVAAGLLRSFKNQEKE